MFLCKNEVRTKIYNIYVQSELLKEVEFSSDRNVGTELPGCIPCKKTKVRRSLAWSFENHNITYNKSWHTITNLRHELYTEYTPGCTTLHDFRSTTLISN